MQGIIKILINTRMLKETYRYFQMFQKYDRPPSHKYHQKKKLWTGISLQLHELLAVLAQAIPSKTRCITVCISS